MATKEQEREYYVRKLAKRAGASDEIRGPRLTLNPAKATVIHIPKEGRKLTADDKEFDQWKRKLTTC
jgi:hypothetical protein